jgi:predicted alpha/beta hydrolase family esterase
VGVHGIWNYGYQRKAGGDLAATVQVIGADWRGWLSQGLGDFDVTVPVPSHLPVAYYADCLFRGLGMGTTEPEDLSPLGQRLFVDWVAELRDSDQLAVSVSEGVLTVPLRESADWFTEHYGAWAQRIVTSCVEELATYFDPAHRDRREAARARVADVIRRERPAVLLAHSLGSVVAYEALCADRNLPVELFVTLGSPLAMRHVVFDRLSPMPAGRGIRPPGVGQWVNIADRGDPVAVPRRKLPERFDGVDRDHETTISLVDPHMAKSYLRCAEVAREIAPYLMLPAAGR